MKAARTAPAVRLVLIVAWLVCCSACLTIQVVTPPAPTQAIETDSEKVRRALADLRAIGTSLEAYAVDQNGYPKPDASDVSVGDFRFTHLDRISTLPVVYRRSLPAFDPWGFPYLYWTDSRHWVLIQTGSEGRIDDPVSLARRIRATLSSEWNAPTQETHCLEDAIVLMDSQFLTRPANDTKRCATSRSSNPLGSSGGR